MLTNSDLADCNDDEEAAKNRRLLAAFDPFLLHRLPPPPPQQHAAPPYVPVGHAPARKNGQLAAYAGGRIVRSAAGRKDRHSKVVTARGLRDRRVRLAAHTAIRFYDVQDRLGVDQPSKAVDWLIRNAKVAIDALPLPAPSAFSFPALSGGSGDGPNGLIPHLPPHLDADFGPSSSSGACCYGGGDAQELRLSLRSSQSPLFGNVGDNDDDEVFRENHPVEFSGDVSGWAAATAAPPPQLALSQHHQLFSDGEALQSRLTPPQSERPWFHPAAAVHLPPLSGFHLPIRMTGDTDGDDQPLSSRW